MFLIFCSIFPEKPFKLITPGILCPVHIFGIREFIDHFVKHGIGIVRVAGILVQTPHIEQGFRIIRLYSQTGLEIVHGLCLIACVPQLKSPVHRLW